MDTKKDGLSAPIWAYAYEFVPPQSEERLRTIKALIDREHSAALRESRTWTGNVLLERQVTAILVVSDSASQHQAINQQLEAELTGLKVGFSKTAPLAVEADASPGSAEALTNSSMEGNAS
jgi:hypothetical protein